MRDLIAAFVTVFVAELGDKSQLLVLAMATRHRAVVVLAGVASSVVVSQTLSVTVGATLAGRFASADVSVAAGLAFLAFAAWTMIERGEPAVGTPIDRTGPAVLIVAAAVFVAELGDKTMFATATLAATGSAVATWVGSFAALLSTASIALVFGRKLGGRISASLLRIGSALVFLAIGLALVIAGVS